MKTDCDGDAEKDKKEKKKGGRTPPQFRKKGEGGKAPPDPRDGKKSTFDMLR